MDEISDLEPGEREVRSAYSLCPAGVSGPLPWGRQLPWEEQLQGEDLSGGVVALERCTCLHHGVVVLTLGSGQVFHMGTPTTKEGACRVLERLFSRYRVLPDQQKFLAAVRQTDWLTGEMPVEI